MKIKVSAPNPTAEEKKHNRGVFVIWASEDGREGWCKVKPEDVPEWVKAPSNLGRLVNGDMCMNPKIGVKGSLWYRADVFLTPVERRRLEHAIKANNVAKAKKILTLH